MTFRDSPMPSFDRRAFLFSATAALALPPAVAKAAAIDADVAHRHA